MKHDPAIMNTAVKMFGRRIHKGERITLEEFADRIEKKYNLNKPTTAEVVTHLRSLKGTIYRGYFNGRYLLNED